MRSSARPVTAILRFPASPTTQSLMRGCGSSLPGCGSCAAACELTLHVNRGRGRPLLRCVAVSGYALDMRPRPATAYDEHAQTRSKAAVGVFLPRSWNRRVALSRGYSTGFTLSTNCEFMLAGSEQSQRCGRL